MTKITDDELMLYIDGELTAEEAKRVETELVHAADTRARLAALRSIRSAAAQAFLPTEMSARLAEFAQSLEVDPSIPDRSSATIQALPEPRSPRSPMGAPREWLAAAAAAAITFSVTTALSFDTSDGTREPMLAAVDGRIVAVESLDLALLAQPSTVSNVDQYTAPIRIITSFISSNGDPCRQFELPGEPRGGGLACFSRGAWQVEVLASLEPEGAFLPAGAGQDPIGAGAVRLGVKRALSPNEEADFIRRKWKAASTPR